MVRPVNINTARLIDTWGGLLACAVLFGISRIGSLFGARRLPPMRATTPPLPGAAPLQPRRILAIKFFGLGNIVMVLPVIQALRDRLPEAEIDFMTLEENLALLERSGLVHTAIGVSTRSYPGFLQSLWRAFRTLRERRYDVVVDCEQFVKLSSVLAFLSGAPERIGFNTDGQRRGWLYTARVVYTDSEHMSRIFMRLLRPLHILDKLDKPRRVTIRTEPAEQARVTALLQEGGIAPGHFPLIAVHVGSGANFYRIPLKRWPVQNFADLCDALVERYGAGIVLTGKGTEEQALVQETQARMRHKPVDACDRLSVTEVLALLRSCHVAVSNDTSVMHLAAAVETPVVAFFGPTAPLHYGPGNSEDLVFYQDLYCSPCLTNYNLKVSRCVDPVCVKTISVADVLAGIEARFLGPEAPLRAALESQAGAAATQRRTASC
jgi:lipopolysaccharide heptosyltransferase II